MPVKSTDTRWIDQKSRVMEREIDKFELSRETNSKNRANKLLEAQIILRSALWGIYWHLQKLFSLITQKENPNINEIVESVDKTKKEYKKLLRKFRPNKDLMFELPTLKSVVSEIEGKKLHTIWKQSSI